MEGELERFVPGARRPTHTASAVREMVSPVAGLGPRYRSSPGSALSATGVLFARQCLWLPGSFSSSSVEQENSVVDRPLKARDEASMWPSLLRRENGPNDWESDEMLPASRPIQ